jgi:hypothetical protein
MYVVVRHRIKDPHTAFSRGERLMRNEGAPSGVRVLQFLPSTDGAEVTCLWEAPAVQLVQEYVDEVLGDSSENTSYEVDAGQAFSDRPRGLRQAAAVGA